MVKCENLPADELKEIEEAHGLLTDVMISGLGIVRCKYAHLEYQERVKNETNNTSDQNKQRLSARLS